MLNFLKGTIKNYEKIFDKTTFLINPAGNFVIGGPHGDTGLTGRKRLLLIHMEVRVHMGEGHSLGRILQKLTGLVPTWPDI